VRTDIWGTWGGRGKRYERITLTNKKGATPGGEGGNLSSGSEGKNGGTDFPATAFDEMKAYFFQAHPTKVVHS